VASGVHCFAYGLRIRSDTLIPGLPSSRTHHDVPDLDIHCKASPESGASVVEVHLPPRDLTRVPTSLPAAVPDETPALAIVYDDGVRFEIDGAARTIWCSWPPTSTLEDVATYLLGPILALVLRLRGTVCLHGSAAIVDGGAVLFVGAAGSGKSTTAAALAQAGCSVIADDVAALDMIDGGFAVRPAYPALRLWPDAVASLYGSADAMPLLTPNWDKRKLDLTARDMDFPSRPVPITTIYLLGPCSDGHGEVKRVAPGRETLLNLVANSYPSTLLDARLRAEELTVLAQLAASVPVYTLSLPDDVTRIAASLDDLMVSA
jgi:hypothetical protein